MQSVASDVLSPHEKLLIDQTVAQHEGHPGALLGILETVQAANAHKFLSLEALRYIADQTGIPPSTIYSTATFYALFNLDPQGDPEQNEANDADKLALTTSDRRFTLRTVACFGQCALAPVAEVNHHILSHVNERTLLREIKTLTRGGK